jgi:hydroxypyruvate isomerase
MNRREFQKMSIAASLASLLPGKKALGAPMAAAEPAGNDGHKFSIMLWTLPKGLTFEQQIELAHRAGFNGVEVGKEYETWTPEEWKKNLAKQHALGIAVDSAVPGRNPLADHSKRQALHDDLMKAVPGAKELGCKQFIYTAYTRVPGQSPEEKKAAIVDSLKYAADLLEKEQIEIVLEPIDLLEYPKEAVPSVAEAFEITRAVGSPRVKVLYDFYHEQKQAGNLIEKLEKNIDQVGLVHIADVPGRHEPGTGEVNYDNIYRKLAELHYDRYICMEFMSRNDPETTLKNARLEAIKAMKSV